MLTAVKSGVRPRRRSNRPGPLYRRAIRKPPERRNVRSATYTSIGVRTFGVRAHDDSVQHPQSKDMRVIHLNTQIIALVFI
jgi:hypothetical protein